MKKTNDKKQLFLYSLLFLLFTNLQGVAQSDKRDFNIIFYNVENLFDLKDDKAIDEEFLAGGARGWSSKKFKRKNNAIAKVILNSTGWDMPDVIGLGEIENRFVLDNLLNNTALSRYKYKIIHKESPDRRGIDIGVLYLENQFYPIDYEMIPLYYSQDSIMNSREIVYISGIVQNRDTIHLFFNHWPSRYSGNIKTQIKREIAAQTVLQKINQLQATFTNPKIILIGDFNDQPSDESLQLITARSDQSDTIESAKIYNLSKNWLDNGLATLKFQSQWFVFDQILVSGSLLQDGLKVKSAQPVQLPFLYEQDKKYGGKKLYRTYHGFKYNGGFSDHLPILLKLSY